MALISTNDLPDCLKPLLEYKISLRDAQQWIKTRRIVQKQQNKRHRYLHALKKKGMILYVEHFYEKYEDSGELHKCYMLADFANSMKYGRCSSFTKKHYFIHVRKKCKHQPYLENNRISYG